jgi:hypothetical protein
VPFKEWRRGTHSLSWYQDYNSVKHDRLANFNLAKFANVLKAISAVFVILFAQFEITAFDPYHEVDMYSADDDGRLSHPSCFFLIEPPTGWTDDELYDFDWKALSTQSDPFQDFTF